MRRSGESLDVDFPADAPKAKTLREIRLELAYTPSPYQAETINSPCRSAVASKPERALQGVGDLVD